MGVLIGVVTVPLVLILGSLWNHPAMFWAFVLGPGFSGYLLRVGVARTSSSAISSIGTALGWPLYLLPAGLGVPVFAELFLLFNLFGPLGLIGHALVLLGYIRLFEWLFGRLGDRVLGSSGVPKAA